ncbi:TPA: hypothetical protein DCZ31_03605 [Patescibacteria group bacterium]|nr:hypothetical protein [Candidatus Gracilibacteria bacterium]
MDNQSILVNGINSEIEVLQTEKTKLIQTDPKNNKILQIDEEIKIKTNNISKIETDVKHLFEQFKTQNEAYLVDALRHQKANLKMS